MIWRVIAPLVLAGCGTPPPARRAPAPPAEVEYLAALPGEPVPVLEVTEPVEADGEDDVEGDIEGDTGADIDEAAPRVGRFRVSGEGIFDYRFERAPVDWLVGAGVWGIASRWHDDPRATFFCGTPRGRADAETPDGGESEQKAVVIWNKRSFRGDVTVDLHIGPRMDSRRGKRYEYVRDFNITIAADGRDLTTGYTFTFGGFGNTRSAILRGDEVLAEDGSPKARYPAGSLVGNRQWFRLRAEREGAKLKFRVCFARTWVVDLEAEDPEPLGQVRTSPPATPSPALRSRLPGRPGGAKRRTVVAEPLTGDRVAIWSYDCAVVVARVRISGLPGTIASVPDFRPPERVRTYYDAASRRP